MSLTFVLNKKKLASAVNDGTRHITITGKEAIVPLHYDVDGKPVTEETPELKKVLKRLSLLDLHFLYYWRENAWNVEKAIVAANVPKETAARLVQKLNAFKVEALRDKTLADIVTPEHVTRRQLENSYTDELTDGQRDSLKELAKITGAYKQQAPTTQINVFNLPTEDPETEKKLKEVFDTIAIPENRHVA